MAGASTRGNYKLQSTLLAAKKQQRKQEDHRRKAKLISEVRIRPAIWNRRLQEHNDRNVVDEMWTQVSQATGLSKMNSRKIWKHLMDHFRNLHYATMRSEKNDPSVDDGEPKKNTKWIFYKPLLFLQDVVCRRNILSNSDGGGTLDNENSRTADSEEPGENVSHICDTLMDSNDTDEKLSEIPSPENTISVLPSASFKTSLKSEAPQEDLRLYENNCKNGIGMSIEERILGQLELLQTVSVVNDTAAKFTQYLAEVLRLVPPQLRRRCEMDILNIVNQYADATEQEISSGTLSMNNFS